MEHRYDFNDTIGQDKDGNPHPKFTTAFTDWQDNPMQSWGEYCELLYNGTAGGTPTSGDGGSTVTIGDHVTLERNENGEPLLGDLGTIDTWRFAKVERLCRLYMTGCYRKSGAFSSWMVAERLFPYQVYFAGRTPRRYRGEFSVKDPMTFATATVCLPALTGPRTRPICPSQPS